MRLLHLSDTHFGAERPVVVRQLLALSAALRPDAIVWSGDITQRATREQFQRAGQFADALPPTPLLVMPGNHDIPLFALLERLIDPYRRFRRAFGGLLEPTLDLPGLQVTMVNTARRWRQQHGALSPRQIVRVSRRLQQAPARAWRLVVTHHPLIVNRPGDRADRPLRHRAALRAWTEAGADALLGGHTHLPFVDRADGPHSPWIVQTGTASSHRLRHGFGNCVHVFTQSWQDGWPARTVDRWDFDEALQRFVERQRVVMD